MDTNESCSSCGSDELLSQISSAQFICFSCAVSKGKKVTDVWLADYCEDDNKDN